MEKKGKGKSKRILDNKNMKNDNGYDRLSSILGQFKCAKKINQSIYKRKENIQRIVKILIPH